MEFELPSWVEKKRHQCIYYCILDSVHNLHWAIELFILGFAQGNKSFSYSLGVELWKEIGGSKRPILPKYLLEQTQKEEINNAVQVELQGLKLSL